MSGMNPNPPVAEPAVQPVSDSRPDGAGGPVGEQVGDRAGREPGELMVGLSPRQIIGGFALLAGLVIWLRRRGRRSG